ncbi:unnamed protein product [Kuraishia capsulata CBS 1993]|uniref:Uncharacterized protein n=1 Tax=Kuraishia capsulata CBS 1993 TaxID=1382522 RepID=W6MR15_9ASCO|nr:uncharacterized protein KUCA_T00005166001 [Kuraishia capsulata CBS 1993]CDK29179.1 unnamed protein product [Kuraishia capsulata CBS 1993]
MVLQFYELKCHKDSILSIYRSLLRASIHINEICPKVEQLQCISKVREEFRRFSKDKSSWRTRKRLIDAGIIDRELLGAFEQSRDVSEYVNTKLSEVLYHQPPPPPPRKLHDNHQEPEDWEEARKRHQKTKLAGYVVCQMKKDQSKHILSHKSKLDRKWMDQVYTSRALFARANTRLGRVKRAVNRPFRFIYKGVHTARGRILFAKTPWGKLLYHDTRNFIAFRRHYERLIAEKPQMEQYSAEYEEMYSFEANWEGLLKTSLGPHYVSEESLMGVEPSNSVSWPETLPRYRAEVERLTQYHNMRMSEHNRKQLLYTSKILPDYKGQLQAKARLLRRIMNTTKDRKIGPYTDMAGESLSKLLNDNYMKSGTKLPALNIE